MGWELRQAESWHCARVHSASLETCLREMWEEHHPCWSEQGQQRETRDCEAECSPFVVCMRMRCFLYVMSDFFLS